MDYRTKNRAPQNGKSNDDRAVKVRASDIAAVSGDQGENGESDRSADDARPKTASEQDREENSRQANT